MVHLNPEILNLLAKGFHQAEALLECTTNILNGIGTVDHSFDLEPRYVNEVGKPVEVSTKLMERYDRQELYELVWAMPMTQVGRKLELGESSVPIICRKMLVPYPPQGYWLMNPSKRTAISRPPLPGIFPG